MRHHQIKFYPNIRSTNVVLWVFIILLLVASMLFYCVYLHLLYQPGDQQSSSQVQVSLEPLKTIYKQDYNHKYCQDIHLGVVCGGFVSTRHFYVLLKSILFYRTDRIFLHIFVDNVSRTILQEIFSNWIVDGLNYKFYNMTLFEDKISWITNVHYSQSYGLMKLIVLDVLIKERKLSKVILIDTDMLVLGNINVIWQEFSNFARDGEIAAIGLVENQSDWYLKKGKLSEDRKVWPALGRGFNSGLILADLDQLALNNWSESWPQIAEAELATHLSTSLADQDIFNAFIRLHSDLLYRLPCTYNIQLNDHAKINDTCLKSHDVKVIHWNSPHKLSTKNSGAELYKNWYLTFRSWDAKLLERSQCDQNITTKNTDLPSSNICSYLMPRPEDNLRIYPFFMDYNYEPQEVDITLILHLSLDRMQTLDEIAAHWQGPISVAIYLTELETNLLIESIEISSNLSHRKNIGYHLAFKDLGYNYPINRLRNLALNHSLTQYVFMSDIDFLPSYNLYDYLRIVISDTIRDTPEKLHSLAFVVPAFESLQYRFDFPSTKAGLVAQLNLGTISMFREQIWPSGHSATDYGKWKAATRPYIVRWNPDYEPFIVTSKSVPRFDERFIGFGWNKVEHITLLAALGYEFVVLPEAFAVHKFHSASYDIIQHRKSAKYRICTRQLRKTFLQELKQRFPNFYNFKGLTSVSNSSRDDI